MAAWKRDLLTRILKLEAIDAETVVSAAGKEPCVMVPSHRPVWDAHAQMSFRRCPEVYSRRAIILVMPEGMDMSAYHRIGSNFTEVRVPAGWQSSPKAHNRMKCGFYFYYKLQNYSHILTHELDTDAFRDEWIFWFVKPSDYIGAPWFARFSKATADDPMTAVGGKGVQL